MTTISTAHNKQLVENFIQELFTDGDLDAVDRHLSSDFVNHDASFPGAPDGPAGMRLAAAMFRQALPDWHSEVEQLVAEDDTVVERFTASGTHRGELTSIFHAAAEIGSAAS
jgi:predicted ester cyclase